MIKALLLLLAVCTPFMARAELPVPPLTGRVTDQTATLTPSQIQALEQTLRRFEERKGSQIAVVLVASTQPESIEQYALRVAEQWKLGRKKVDDGAILLIAKDDRALRIEVGYGLEGALGDAVSKRIISEVIVPRLREGGYYAGITEGVDRMIRVVDGEPLPAPAATPGQGDTDLPQWVPLILIVALVTSAALRSWLGRMPGALAAAGVVGLITWLVAGALAAGLGGALITFVLTSMSGLGGHGMHGHHGRRHGGFGSGLGGGFRGGGGGFGGGGASGRW